MDKAYTVKAEATPQRQQRRLKPKERGLLQRLVEAGEEDMEDAEDKEGMEAEKEADMTAIP